MRPRLPLQLADEAHPHAGVLQQQPPRLRPALLGGLLQQERASGRRDDGRPAVHVLQAQRALQHPPVALLVEHPARAVLELQESCVVNLHALLGHQERPLPRARADLAAIGEAAAGPQRDSVRCGDAVEPVPALGHDLLQPHSPVPAVDGPARRLLQAQECRVGRRPALHHLHQLTLADPDLQLGRLRDRGRAAQGDALGVHHHVLPLAELCRRQREHRGRAGRGRRPSAAAALHRVAPLQAVGGRARAAVGRVVERLHGRAPLVLLGAREGPHVLQALEAHLAFVKVYHPAAAVG
mmetsp:Transcript_60752/g.161611  ORF Transcript_60752/g.161611 Transcript_60752/m.161611 type:complete len:296 (+) Transcript_60752:535-1422(+)